MEPKKCSMCGAPIKTTKAGEYTCPYCESKTIISDSKIIQEEISNNINKQTNKKSKYIFITVFLIVLGCIAYYLFFNNMNNEEIINQEIVETEIVYSSYTSAKIGDYIQFGQYEQDCKLNNGKEPIEWLVLSRTEEGILVISKDGLDCRRYNDEFGFTSWQECTLRKWLNDDFYNIAFNSEEKKLIKPTDTTETNSVRSSIDKVFLLSTLEAEKYFVDDAARILYATDYAIANGVAAYESGASWWWLRTICEDSEYATNVRSKGNLRYSSEIAVNSDGYAIRPAMWISFTEIKEEKEVSKQIVETKKEESNTFEITVLDEKIGVYSSPYDDRQWVKAIYNGETHTCYEVYIDDIFTWYRIGKDMWIKDAYGSRVRTPMDPEKNEVKYDKTYSSDKVNIGIVGNKLVVLSGETKEFDNIISSHYSFLTDNNIEIIEICSGVKVNGGEWMIDPMTLILDEGITTIYSFPCDAIFTTVYVPSSLKVFASGAFCSLDGKSKTIYYSGSQEQWNELCSDNGYIKPFNPADDAEIYFNYTY